MDRHEDLCLTCTLTDEAQEIVTDIRLLLTGTKRERLIISPDARAEMRSLFDAAHRKLSQAEQTLNNMLSGQQRWSRR